MTVSEGFLPTEVLLLIVDGITDLNDLLNLRLTSSQFYGIISPKVWNNLCIDLTTSRRRSMDATPVVTFDQANLPEVFRSLEGSQGYVLKRSISFTKNVTIHLDRKNFSSLDLNRISETERHLETFDDVVLELLTKLSHCTNDLSMVNFRAENCSKDRVSRWLGQISKCFPHVENNVTISGWAPLDRMFLESEVLGNTKNLTLNLSNESFLSILPHGKASEGLKSLSLFNYGWLTLDRNTLSQFLSNCKNLQHLYTNIVPEPYRFDWVPSTVTSLHTEVSLPWHHPTSLLQPYQGNPVHLPNIDSLTIFTNSERVFEAVIMENLTQLTLFLDWEVMERNYNWMEDLNEYLFSRSPKISHLYCEAQSSLPIVDSCGESLKTLKIDCSEENTMECHLGCSFSCCPNLEMLVLVMCCWQPLQMASMLKHLDSTCKKLKQVYFVDFCGPRKPDYSYFTHDVTGNLEIPHDPFKTSLHSFSLLVNMDEFNEKFSVDYIYSS